MRTTKTAWLGAGGVLTIAALATAAGIRRPESISLLSEGLFLLVAPAALIGAVVVQWADGTTTTYRWAVRIALATTCLLFLLIGVGGFLGSDSDHPADFFYILVPAIGLAGALMARFEAHGMVRALFATAFAQVVVPIVAVAFLGREGPGYPLEVVAVNAPFAALFIGSGVLFGHAARNQTQAVQEPKL